MKTSGTSGRRALAFFSLGVSVLFCTSWVIDVLVVNFQANLDMWLFATDTGRFENPSLEQIVVLALVLITYVFPAGTLIYAVFKLVEFSWAKDVNEFEMPALLLAIKSPVLLAVGLITAAISQGSTVMDFLIFTVVSPMVGFFWISPVAALVCLWIVRKIRLAL